MRLILEPRPSVEPTCLRHLLLASNCRLSRQGGAGCAWPAPPASQPGHPGTAASQGTQGQRPATAEGKEGLGRDGRAGPPRHLGRRGLLLSPWTLVFFLISRQEGLGGTARAAQQLGLGETPTWRTDPLGSGSGRCGVGAAGGRAAVRGLPWLRAIPVLLSPSSAKSPPRHPPLEGARLPHPSSLSHFLLQFLNPAGLGLYLTWPLPSAY